METFNRMHEITTLLQYLYMGNPVVYHRAVKGDVVITMNPDGKVMMQEDGQSPKMMGLSLQLLFRIIDQLKNSNQWLAIKSKLTCQSCEHIDRPSI